MLTSSTLQSLRQMVWEAEVDVKTGMIQSEEHQTQDPKFKLYYHQNVFLLELTKNIYIVYTMMFCLVLFFWQH
jgi:hypothetical protein